VLLLDLTRFLSEAELWLWSLLFDLADGH
jgi:hypothetical protein